MKILPSMALMGVLNPLWCREDDEAELFQSFQQSCELAVDAMFVIIRKKNNNTTKRGLIDTFTKRALSQHFLRISRIWTR